MAHCYFSLCLFQCLCEELEYSDLLDKAVLCEDPYDRMVTVAAFAISAYASTYTRFLSHEYDLVISIFIFTENLVV